MTTADPLPSRVSKYVADENHGATPDEVLAEWNVSPRAREDYVDTARPRTRDYLPSICMGCRIFCTSVRQRCSARMTHRPLSGSRVPLFERCSQHGGTKSPSSSLNFAHRNRAIGRSDVQNSDGRFLDAQPGVVVPKLPLGERSGTSGDWISLSAVAFVHFGLTLITQLSRGGF